MLTIIQIVPFFPILNNYNTPIDCFHLHFENEAGLRVSATTSVKQLKGPKILRVQL